MRRISLLTCLVVLGVMGIASAQLPVAEVGQNLAYNGVQAAEAVFQSAQWVIDLLPLEAWEIVQAMGDALSLLSALAAEAQAIGMDIASIQVQLTALFGLESAPLTSFAYRQRVADIHWRIWQVYGYAMRTQTLINTIMHTVEHIIGFVNQVAELLGTLSVQQTLAQQLAKLQQLQAEANLVLTAKAFAESVEALAPGVLQQGVQNITDAMMEDHPRW
jgi:hypothetical protein